MIRTQFRQVRLSTIYQTVPVGLSGDDFWNAVISAETDWSPQQVKAKLRVIETECGRTRIAERLSARTMDLDLLLYGDLVDESLALPHPDLQRYGFVLGPMADIAPNLVPPGSPHPIHMLWAQFTGDKTLTPIDDDTML